MRLEKKTMATLLAAILIAMAGVMTALAAYTNEAEELLGVTVEKLPLELEISVAGYTGFDPDPVTQGDPTALITPILLTVSSPTEVTVEAELRDTVAPFDPLVSGLFYDYMKPNVDGDGETTFDAFTITHPADTEDTYSITATIYVPLDADTVLHQATLVFWIVEP